MSPRDLRTHTPAFHMTTRPFPSLLSGLMLLAIAGAVGCGGDDGEAAFRAASDRLAEAKSEAEVARDAVDQRREELEVAEVALEEAQAQLAATETRVDEARDELAAFATDDVVFRAVQLALLETDELREVAIRASVAQGVVTLLGRVDEAEERDLAVEVAKSIPGVVSVESEIEVAGESAGMPSVGEAAPSADE